MEVALTGSPEDSNVYLWEIRTGTLLATYRLNSCDVNGMCFLGDDHFVATQQKKAMHIWTWKKEPPLLQCTTAEKLGPIEATSDGLYCAAGSTTGLVFLWDVVSGHLLRTHRCHYTGVTALSFSSDGSLLITGGSDGIVHVWLLASLVQPFVESSGASGQDAGPRPLASFSDHSLSVTSLLCGAGGLGCRVLSTSLDRTCKLWDLASRSLLGSFVLPTYLSACALSPSESTLYLGGGDARIFQIDLCAPPPAAVSGTDTGDSSGLFLGHTQAVTALGVSFDGSLLVSAAADGSCLVWDTYSHQVLRSFVAHRGPVSTLRLRLRPDRSSEHVPRMQPPLRHHLQPTGALAPLAVELAYTPELPALVFGLATVDATVQLHSDAADKALSVARAQNSAMHFVAPSADTRLMGEIRMLESSQAQWQQLCTEMQQFAAKIVSTPPHKRAASPLPAGAS